MDKLIKIPAHPNHPEMMEFYSKKLDSKFSPYIFVKKAEIQVERNPFGEYEIALRLQLEKAHWLYCKDSNRSENKALHGVLKKMRPQIEKYKQKHYHDFHTVSKSERNPMD